MILYLLIFSVLVSGIFLYYTYYISPRLNPVKKAEKYLKNEQHNEAVLEYKKALDRNGADFVVHFRLANIYLQQKEIDQAVLHLEKILDLNAFNYEVEKLDVQKKLASAYQVRDEPEKAFQMYYDILRYYPVDQEALYNVTFMALGQEEFEIAQRYAEKLVNLMPNSFEVVFAAGMCNYQNKRINDASSYFKTAAALKPGSDIANLAAALTLQKKGDYRLALSYVQKIPENDNDPGVIFISRRLQGIILLQGRKHDEAIKIFEELLNFAKTNEMQEEVLLVLYDIGFVAAKAERTNQAYEYWNELYRLDKSYKKIQSLVMMLRKEMELDYRTAMEEPQSSLDDYTEAWLEEIFPADFLWNICGLKSDRKLNLKGIMTTARVQTAHGDESGLELGSGANFEKLERFNTMNVENFRIASNRLVAKMGYKVEQILQTYRENDGVDFLAVSPEKEKTLIWVRRWTKARVGEIPFRNFAQAINDIKAKKGVFVTSSEITEAAEISLKNLSKVVVVQPDELASLLEGLV